MERLFGLVVCGGQSSRMGTDKSLLEYYGQPQRYYLYKMLKGICKEVFLSLRQNQLTDRDSECQVIIDDSKYNNIGPMAALLSAFEKYPGSSFLVIGCDYPLIQKSNLEGLISRCEVEQYAISFYNTDSNFREPLLGVYKNKCYEVLENQFIEGNYSLNYFLKSVNAGIITPASTEILLSVDTPQAYNEIINKLNSKGI